MDVRDLNREQLTELKQHYMVQLTNEGTFAEIVGRDYDAPSMEDLANADDIVPDDVIFRNYEGINFVADDFFCTEWQETYYQPEWYRDDGTNIEYCGIPEDLYSFQVFSTKERCVRWLKDHDYHPDDFVIREYHDDDIEDYIIIS